MSGVLEAVSLVKSYGTPPNETMALRGVSLSVAEQESVAIMGRSGSGKSTLLHILAGILPPTSGSVLLRGRNIAELSDAQRTALRRSEFGFVFQSGQLLPELPADENAAVPLLLAGVKRDEATAVARQHLAALGLAGMEDRRPGELSGGQAQRVAIARALTGDPAVIFADEPTGAVDKQTGIDVMNALTSAAKARGAALIVVTHDPEVARWCSRTVHLSDGLVEREERRDGVAGQQP